MKKNDAFIDSDTLKKWLKYVIYAIVIFAYITFFTVIDEQIKILVSKTYDSRMENLVLLFGNIIFGIILGMERFLHEMHRKGKWGFNIPRIILIGIPSLIFAMYLYIYYSNNSVLILATDYLPKFITSNTFISLNQILFGYVLITNFSKKKT